MRLPCNNLSALTIKMPTTMMTLLKRSRTTLTNMQDRVWMAKALMALQTRQRKATTTRTMAMTNNKLELPRVVMAEKMVTNLSQST